MGLYSPDDIQKGNSVFNHVMRTQKEIPGFGTTMSRSLAVGVISSAMRSGLPDALIKQVIEKEFVRDARVLLTTLQLLEGDDWDVDLWKRLPSGQYKLCTDLCRPHDQGWRYDKAHRGSDW